MTELTPLSYSEGDSSTGCMKLERFPPLYQLPMLLELLAVLWFPKYPIIFMLGPPNSIRGVLFVLSNLLE